MISAFQKLSVVLSLLWTVLLVVSWSAMIASPSGWTEKVNLVYTLKLGLTQAELSEGSWKAFAQGILGSKMSNKVLSKIHSYTNHKMTTNEHWEFWCLIGANHCLTVKIVAISTWVTFSCCILGVVLLVVGGVLLYVWAFGKARARLRRMIKAAYTIASVAFMIGSVQYYCLAKFVTSLPPVSNGNPTGTLTMLALLLTVSSFVPTWVVWSLRATEDEIRNSLEDEFARIGQGLKSQPGYGGTSAIGKAPLPPPAVHYPLSDPALGSSFGPTSPRHPANFPAQPYPPVFTGNPY